MRGFTFIELLLVLTLVALLAGLAAPVVTGSILRAREAALMEDLRVMRKALDDYYADHDRYVAEVQLLIDRRYLRRLPVDPFTDRSDSWIFTREQEGDGGITDVQSGAEGIGSNGLPYREW